MELYKFIIDQMKSLLENHTLTPYELGILKTLEDLILLNKNEWGE